MNDKRQGVLLEWMLDNAGTDVGAFGDESLGEVAIADGEVAVTEGDIEA